MPDCLFCQIVAGQIPAKRVYEDETVYAFEDIHPQAPTHVLVVPKLHLASLADAQDEHAGVLGYMQIVAAHLARARGLDAGYRTVINTGPHAGQTVPHIHLHLLGGREFAWPPG